MNGHLRIYVELRGHGARGPRYRVRMNKPDGMVIIDGTTEPLFDAARVLVSKGIAGRLEMWDGQRPFCRMSGNIERLAGLTVSEGQDGIALRKYVERTDGGQFEDEAPEGAGHEVARPGRVLQGADRHLVGTDLGFDLDDHIADLDVAASTSARSSARSAVVA